MITQKTATRILIYYLSELTRRVGLRWTEENSADIRMAVSALASGADTPETIPPYLRSNHESNGDEGLRQVRAWKAARGEE
jgi:hypothetical protein